MDRNLEENAMSLLVNANFFWSQVEVQGFWCCRLPASSDSTCQHVQSTKSDALAYSILELFSCSEKPSEIWKGLSASISWNTARFDPSRRKTSRTIYCSAVYCIYIHICGLFSTILICIWTYSIDKTSPRNRLWKISLFCVGWRYQALRLRIGVQRPKMTEGLQTTVRFSPSALFKTPKHLEGVSDLRETVTGF